MVLTVKAVSLLAAFPASPGAGGARTGRAPRAPAVGSVLSDTGDTLEGLSLSFPEPRELLLSPLALLSPQVLPLPQAVLGVGALGAAVLHPLWGYRHLNKREMSPKSQIPNVPSCPSRLSEKGTFSVPFFLMVWPNLLRRG